MIAKLLILCVGVVVPALAENVPFIIGGTTVGSAATWPWQCSLQYNGGHYCGASLISDIWLVTAAHCIQNPLSSYAVKCGSLRYADGVRRTLSQKIEHEDYGTGSGAFPNDIAVIKLSSAMPIGTNIKTVTMTSKEHAGNRDCYITGWGVTTTGGGSVSSVLKQANINVYTNSVCENTWGNSINSGHVCIGDSANGRGSCNGDSGGPLVCKEGNNYELVGATSWGVRGCYTSYPSVYSRITFFREWIKGKTGI